MLSYIIFIFTFMTLNRLSCPRPSFSLKKSCSGNVLAMSRRIIFSLGDFCFKYSTYMSFIGEVLTSSSNCHANPRNGWGIPLRTSCCKMKKNIKETFQPSRNNVSGASFIKVRYPAAVCRMSCGHQVRQVGFLRVLQFPPHEDHPNATSVPTSMINISCITCFVIVIK